MYKIDIRMRNEIEHDKHYNEQFIAWYKMTI